MLDADEIQHDLESNRRLEVHLITDHLQRAREGDPEMVEDLIIAAFADGKAKADRVAAEKMQSLTEGLPLPPGMKLPF